jgi:lysophospholipase L1-like esterase
MNDRFFTKTYLFWGVLALWIACFTSSATPVFAQHAFEADIRAYEVQDSINPPAKGQIVLYGSSTIRMWTGYAQDLKGFSVLNRGFGGSTMSDAVYYFDRVLVPLQPSWILLYEGDNDLAFGQTPEQAMGTLDTLYQLMRRKLPDTRLAIYAVKPSVARKELLPKQQILNKKFRKFAKKHRKYVFFLDTATPLLGSDRQPSTDYLIEDGLHLNARGYAIWTAVTRRFLNSQ